MKKIGLDLLCVAAHYSKRYENSDNFIENKSDGFLIKNGNETDYIEAVLYLINNETKRIEMGKNAKQKSLNYHIDTIMPLWNSLFKDLISKSSS